jgi:hypothetical protein
MKIIENNGIGVMASKAYQWRIVIGESWRKLAKMAWRRGSWRYLRWNVTFARKLKWQA